MKFSSLPVLNILGKKERSLALFIFAILLSFSIFGGIIILSSLRNGLKSLEERLGADIIVVPFEARTKVSADVILNQGNRTFFYMNRSVVDKIKEIEGVEKASPQIYLCSMNAGCCSVSVQLIGFDPDTDFTIQPWSNESFRGSLGTGDVLIGSKVSMPQNRVLKFFNQNVHVAAQLEETGTGLDNAVYANLETIQLLLDSANTLNYSVTNKAYSEKMISSVMVKVFDDCDIDGISSQIQRKVHHTQAIKAKSMTSGIADSLASVSKIIELLTGIVWVLCLVVLMVVSNLIINERKKEFAVLRIIGSSRRKLSHLVIAESAILNFAGGTCGIILAALCILPFHTLIKNAVGLPFLLPELMEIIKYVIVTLFLSVVCGCLTSSYAAHKIACIDTGMIIREG